MIRNIIIGDDAVGMRVTALTPRRYRYIFGRDLFIDVGTLQKKLTATMKTSEQFTAEELQTFLNITWMFAHENNSKNLPKTPDEMLESFRGAFSIYTVLPQILKMFIDSEKIIATAAELGKPSMRAHTTGLFMLRCAELHLTAEDLDEMDIGMIYDMLVEKANDNHKYPTRATQEDIRAFFG